MLNLLAASVTLSVWEWIIGAILILASLLVIFVVLLQEGRQANVGVISGAADSFMEKGAAQSLDQKLAKWTKVIAIGFFVLVLAGMLVTKFLSNEALKSGDASSTTTTTTTTHDHDHDHDHGTTTTTAANSNTNDGELSW